MCGLAGFFTTFLSEVDREKFQFLMLLSTTRGIHSAGAMSLVRHGAYNQAKDIRYHYLKAPIHPVAFLETPEWKNMARVTDTKGFMGHTRAATMGAINSANAHPFISENGRIVGAHNGTLMGDYPGKDEGKTDSEHLINTLSTKGLSGLNNLTGAWALSFLDGEDDTFNLIRNNERPLSYMVTKSGDFAYASEKWMLEALKSKFSLEGGIENLPPYMRLQLDLTNQDYIKTLSVAKVEGLEAPKVNSHSAFFRGERWQDQWDEADRGSGHHQGYYGAYEPLIQQHQPKWERPTQQPTTRGRDFAGPTAPVGRSRGPQGIGEVRKALPSPGTQSEGTKETSKTQGPKEEVGRTNGGLTSRNSTPSSTRGPTDVSKGASGKRLLADLPERQRVEEGKIFVETFRDHWIEILDFLHIIDHTVCKWSDESSNLTEKRLWLNKEEFVLQRVYDHDPECRLTLGDVSSMLIRN